MENARRLQIEERARIPADGAALGYGSILPLLGAGVAALAGVTAATEAGILWGAALLLFFSGVRRGLSFRTEGGPRLRQIAATLALFVLGLAALLAPAGWALAALGLGFAGLLADDPAAARRGEVPLYFARLRPPQLGLALASLAALALAARL
jgi:hypothetical protein